MTSIGKRFLSAFVEVQDSPKETATPVAAPSTPLEANHVPNFTTTATENSKFQQHFETLFSEANIPGPDYYEFSKMIEAMQSIADEKARYSAAFAGLQVQGLDKQKLLSTAESYNQLLDEDAVSFHATIDAAMLEKVNGKQKEIENKKVRIQQLSDEINQLHQSITALENEVKENERKIYSNTGGYKAAMATIKKRIAEDIQKINQHIN